VRVLQQVLPVAVQFVGVEGGVRGHRQHLAVRGVQQHCGAGILLQQFIRPDLQIQVDGQAYIEAGRRLAVQQVVDPDGQVGVSL